MSFSLPDIDNKQLVKNQSKINMLNNLLKNAVLLKPDKDNGIDLVDCLDYKNSFKQNSSDRTKFPKTNEYLTFRRLSFLQQYLRKLRNAKKFQKRYIKESDY